MVSWFFLHENILVWSFGLPVSYRYTSCMLPLLQTLTFNSVRIDSNNEEIKWIESKVDELVISVHETELVPLAALQPGAGALLINRVSVYFHI